MDGVFTRRAPMPRLEHLPHASFVLLVGAAVMRLASWDGPLCPYILALTATLATLYTVGLALWHRLGRGRPAWWGALMVVWLLLLHLAPPSVQYAYTWCAVPLTCVTLRALPARATVPAVAAITAALVVTLGGHSGVVAPDAVAAPVAALWATAALYDLQRRTALSRQRLIDELHRTRGELARREREAGVLAERARIAGDIHDSLTQDLAGSRMLLQAAERDWQQAPEIARARVRAAIEALGSNLVEARRLIADLTPAALDRGDLALALAELCAGAQQVGAAAQVRFQAAGDLTALPPEPAATVLRVAQGAVANAREHAAATTILVTVRRHGGAVVLQVRDDGAGLARNGRPGAPGRGFGVPAMRARVQAAGGSFLLDSTPGCGTTVTAVVPLAAEPGPTVESAPVAVAA